MTKEYIEACNEGLRKFDSLVTTHELDDDLDAAITRGMELLEQENLERSWYRHYRD